MVHKAINKTDRHTDRFTSLYMLEDMAESDTTLAFSQSLSLTQQEGGTLYVPASSRTPISGGLRVSAPLKLLSAQSVGPVDPQHFSCGGVGGLG